MCAVQMWETVYVNCGTSKLDIADRSLIAEIRIFLFNVYICVRLNTVVYCIRNIYTYNTVVHTEKAQIRHHIPSVNYHNLCVCCSNLVPYGAVADPGLHDSRPLVVNM